MIRHIVLFKYKTEASALERESLEKQLASLSDSISEIGSLRIARDIGRKANSYDFALDSAFDSMEDVETYAAHPDHVKALETIGRICQSVVKIDYESED